MTITDLLAARAFLLRATEPPAPAVGAFVVAHGPVEAVERIRSGAAPQAVLQEICNPRSRIDDDLAAIDAGRGRLLTPDDPGWPHGAFHSLSEHGLGAPLGLWVRGNAGLAESTRAAVSVVGSRAATGYGEHVAKTLGMDLSRSGVTVLASGAYGIDGHAHCGALLGPTPPIAVLACGVDVAYPQGHARLLDSVAHNGLLISEYPFGTRPTRPRFAARGRLLAALGVATVVVEAGLRSGAVAVAYTAAALGRRVYGVPGPITSAASTGVTDLFRAGVATPIAAADHITHQEGIR
ncbi:DNA processing protein [Saccharopolyspora shandongensis]|uniref:DNA processing protein n=1 Tax=Saccharopolyspora shandongensis TaxID=418495 RepID=A0A1H2T7I7_9PSEU|nr:DNA-processing protein DprA [Saccharopolyspora shandongensis]SDW39239.1 DNA processing protein [Saccharopolyspora shandongensis]